MRAIENLASGKGASRFMLAAVSGSTNTVAGYVYASASHDELKRGHCKVDRSHQGKGSGGLLLLQAAEVNARKKGSRHSKVKLGVLETNEAAIKCYRKAAFATYDTGVSSLTHPRTVPGKLSGCSWRKTHLRVDVSNGSLLCFAACIIFRG